MINVRSQDREILAKVKSLSISEISENGKINQYSIDGEVANGNTYELGVYSTREKAVKVLDKISGNLVKGWEIYEPVFQMPQDDEVRAWLK